MAINLEQYLEDVVLRYDPTADIGSGGAARKFIIDPIIERLSPDAIDTPISAFVKARIDELYPESKGEVFQDIINSILSVVLRPLQAELSSIRALSQSRTDLTISREELEIRAQNFFVTARAGSRSRVLVRLFFANPRTVTIGLGTGFTTGSGLWFHPVRTYVYTSDEMSLNYLPSEALYYIDVVAAAAEPGVIYNINSGEITGVEGVDDIVRITNPNPADGRGEDQDSSSRLLARLQDSIASAAPDTIRGITRYMDDRYGDNIGSLFVAGFGDIEMVRDILQTDFRFGGTYPGPAIVTGIGIPIPLTLPSKIEYGFTNWFDCGVSLADVRINDFITIIQDELGTLVARDFTIAEIVGSTIRIAELELLTSGEQGGYIRLFISNGADITVGTDKFQSPEANAFITAGAGDVLAYSDPYGTPTDTVEVTLSGVDTPESVFGPRILIRSRGIAGKVELPIVVGSVSFDTLAPVSGAVTDLYLSVWDGGIRYGNLKITAIVGATKVIVNNSLPFFVALDDTIDWFFTVYKISNGVAFPLTPPDVNKANIHYAVIHWSGDAAIVQPGSASTSFIIRRPESIEDAEVILTVGGIPGGALGTEFADDEVHMGGCYDAWIYDRTLENARGVLDVVIDNDEDVPNMVVTINSSDPYVATAASAVPIDPAGNFWRNAALVIEDAGVDSGPYRIAHVDGTVIILADAYPSDLTAGAAHITAVVDIDLFVPRQIKVEGTSLTTASQQSTVWVSEDLPLNGVSSGDVLEILNGSDRGQHSILTVGANYMVLSSQMSAYGSTIGYQVYRRFAELVRRPLAEIKSVSLLPDTNIPYARPVAAVSETLSGSVKKVPSDEETLSDLVITDGTHANSNEGAFISQGVVPGDFLIIPRGPNANTYRIEEITQIGGISYLVINDSKPFPTVQSNVEFAIGAPSSGLLYLYFKDRREVVLNSDFSAEHNGALFTTNPFREGNVGNGFAELKQAGGFTWIASNSAMFYDIPVVVGDILEIPYRDIRSLDTGGAQFVSGQTLKIRVADNREYNITFEGGGSIALDAVSPKGIVQQIGYALRNEAEVEIFADTFAGDFLVIRGTQKVELVSGSFLETAVFTGMQGTNERDPSDPNNDRYRVVDVERKKVFIETFGGLQPTLVSDIDIFFRVKRQQFLRFAPFDLEAIGSFFRIAVPVVSAGFGDAYNLADETVMDTDLILDGYHFRNNEEGLTGGPIEETTLIISATFMDTYDERLSVPANSISVSYTWSLVAQSADQGLKTDDSRPVTASTMVKHLFIGMASMELRQSGGTPSAIKTRIEQYIRELQPAEALEAFDIQRLLHQERSRDLEEPTMLYVLYMDPARRFHLEVGSNQIVLPRTVKLLPGVINVL